MKNAAELAASAKFSLGGIVYAYRNDKSFRMEVNILTPAYLLVGWLLAPFAPLELVIFVFSYLFILFAELVNTALETTIDHLHPARHKKMGAAKDIASGAVLVTLVFAFILTLALAYSRFV
jgi:undecaprenol kinase